MLSATCQSQHCQQDQAMLSLYESAMAATSCGIVISDASRPDTPVIYCNPAFERITGYSRTEIVGHNCRMLQGADTDPAAIEQIRISLSAGRECKVVLKNYRKDGTPFWNDLAISPVRDDEGRVTHYIGVQTDITERVVAQEQAQLMQFSLERSADAAFWITADARFFYVNEAACRSLGYSREELLSLSVLDIDRDFPPASWLQPWEAIKQHGSLTLETHYQTKQGRLFPVEVTLNCIQFNGQEYYCALVRDITARKLAEAELRSAAEREQVVGAIATSIRRSLDLQEVLSTAVNEVRQVLQTDRVVLYRFDPDWYGTVLVESVGDWTPVLGTNIQDTCFINNHAPLYQQGRVRAIDDIYAAGLEPCHIQMLEQFEVRANLIVPVLQGEKLWGLLIAHHCNSPRHWQEDEVKLLKQLSVHLAIALQQAELYQQLSAELTERKAAEAALRESETKLKQQTTHLETALRELKQAQSRLIQSEKMSSLGQLVAGVAHEINNPVSFITGNLTYANQYAQELLHLLQLYRQHYPQPVSQIQSAAEQFDINFLIQDFPKLLNSMEVGADRIRQIVLSLRNFCRLDEAESKSVDLHEGLDNTLMILQHRLKPQGNKSGIALIKEYGALPNIECYADQLNQVFMNLISNAIDAIEESLADHTGQIRIRTTVVNNSRIAISIADNGCGIPEAIRQRIFDPFFTTKSVGSGTGLGLSISYQIVVQKHGGQLHCYSAPSQGTEFVVEIPCGKQIGNFSAY